MLPDKVIKKLLDDVFLHFQVKDARLEDAALKLADAGWPWEEIRTLLSQVHSVAREDGYADGYAEGYSCGYGDAEACS